MNQRRKNDQKLETKKQLWEVPFTRLPELLTIEDIAEFLRIDI